MTQTAANNQATIASDQLDLRGRGAAWAILCINQRLKGLPAGGHLEVLASDPDLPESLPAILAHWGHRLVGREDSRGCWSLIIQKSGRRRRPDPEQPTQHWRYDMSQVLSDIPDSAGSVDARGSACPGPLLEAKKAIASVKVGEVLEVLSNDPGTKDDIPVWANKVGHEYIGHAEADGYERVFVRRMK